MQDAKRVLLVHYSQTGSTEQLANSFCAPIQSHQDIELTTVPLQAAPPYEFPWRFYTFFDTFPETVQLRPPELAPIPIEPDYDFDLVILAYPVWFLSPAPPMAAFLMSEIGRRIVANTPTITLASCRNMWLKAHETVTELLDDAEAQHCDNVVVTDPGPSLATFITTPRWMFTGRRDRFLGMPPAGISGNDITNAARFGRAIIDAFENGRVGGKQPLLTGLRAVTVNDALLANEQIGYRSFRIWSRLVRLFGKPGAPPRRIMLTLYCLFLTLMIITIVPPSLAIRAVLRRIRPSVGAEVRQRHAQPSGQGDERMEQFS